MILRLDEPLRRKDDDDDVERSRAIQSLHQALKPNFCIRLRMYSEETLSKALAMSNLSRRAGVFFLWSALTQFWTYMKLSWMHLVRRKADWAGEMRVCMTVASLIERTLEMSLATEWIKLIGL